MTQTLTPAQQAWQSELDSVGRVTIKSSTRDLWWRVGVAIALVALFVGVRYSSGDIGQRGLTIAIVGFALLIIGLIVFVHMYYGNKQIVVDASTLTTMSNENIPWTDVATVGVYAPAKSPPAVSVNMTSEAWDRYLSSKSAAAKAMHKANKVVTRDRSLVLPSYLDANANELASWLNQFARGEIED